MESFPPSGVDADEIVSHRWPLFQFSGDFGAQLEDAQNAVARRKGHAMVFVLHGLGENVSHCRFEIEDLSDNGIRRSDHFSLWRLRDKLNDVLSMARDDEPV
jgi:hypothetical protein